MNGTNPSLMLDITTHLDAPDVLDAGKLCLEFANTSDWHASEQPVETIGSYQDLVAWATRVGVRSDESAAELLTQAQARPEMAAQIYSWAIELREAIYRIFSAIAEDQKPAAADLTLLNEALLCAYSLPEVVATEGGFGWRWRGDENGLDGMLWPILRSAATLLTAGELNRVGQCADDRGCGYLFYDTSRNRSRRWCDMNSCGNRAKSQRHYARHRHDTPA
ncbi:MAG: ABATE domain-containing protein [Caldilineaceae bacterium]|nr:ABATE domain-containing protein [Caldilineaceae bacterium]